MIKHIARFTAAACFLALTAPALAKDVLTIGVSQFPSSLHPSIDAMAAKSYVLGMTRRPFTTYDENWSLTCMLCAALPSLEAGTAAYETRPDGRPGMSVTYTIRPGARWDDGTPVTTTDVLFTWRVGRHPKSGFSNAQLYNEDILEITAKDASTFTIHLSKRMCDYKGINDFELLPAHVEKAVFEADPDNYRNRSLYRTDPTHAGLAYGPYRIVSVDSGSSMVLETNPTWWGKPPAFRKIIVRAIENSAALETNLLSGDIDYIPGEIGLPLDQALAIEKRHGQRFNITYKAGLFYEHIDINFDNPILSDQRVRQALLYAIDRAAISKQLFAGRQPVADGFVSPLDKDFAGDIRKYAYDPILANRLLDQAGWSVKRGGVRHSDKGDRLQLSLSTTAGTRARELVAQVLQAQWKQIGIDVRIENQPPRVLFGQTLRERRFSGMAMFAWLSAPHSIPRTMLHSTMIPTTGNGFAGQNFLGFRNAEADKIIDDLEVACEPSANHALWKQLQQLYAETLPALPLFFRADAYLKPKALTGVVPTGHQYPSTLWIENWRWAP